MFEGSLVESTSLLRSRNRWPAVASVAVQAALAAVLIAIPLLHPEVIPLTTPHLTLFAPPLPRPVPPPPPVQPIRVQASSSSVPSAPATPAQPAQLSNQIASTNHPVDNPVIATNINLGTARPNLPDAGAGSGVATDRVVPAPAANATRSIGKPLPVSTGVLAGLLLEPIRPIYPQIAKMTRTEGDVIVQAVISRAGQIESAHVVSGSPMLQAAALDAVRAAHYRPYLLNGEPTEVETTYTIHFRLGS